MSEQSQTQKPIKRFPYNKVTASIWEKQTADGRLFYTTTFSKSYSDKQTGERKHSSSFTHAELSEIPLLINQVSPHIQMLNERNKALERSQVQHPQEQETGLATQRDAVMNNRAKPEKSNNIAAPTQRSNQNTPDIQQ